MSRSGFIKHIKTLNEEDLREELKNVYSRFLDVRKYYTLELGEQSDREKVYKKAKKEISNLYLIRGLHRKRPRVQKLNKLFSELKKNSVFPHELIDVYLHSADHGIRFIRETRKSPDPVCNHLLKCFEEALKIIESSMLKEKYSDKINGLLRQSDSLYFMGKKLRGLADKYQ